MYIFRFYDEHREQQQKNTAQNARVAAIMSTPRAYPLYYIYYNINGIHTKASTQRARMASA